MLEKYNNYSANNRKCYLILQTEYWKYFSILSKSCINITEQW